MDSPFDGEATRARPQPQEPIVVQLDPKCFRSALKEFFEPLRSNDPRADFFAMYRKEADEFDRDYAKKYDEDLNTSLIFAGLFSAVSSAFIIDVQSKLEPDPNEMTAAYMKILIHAVNGSLFPDADPDATVWTGPPSTIVVVQSLLYASLATSLFASFFAMFGKQWVSRYIRNRGGSAADKSRNRQRKLDGFEKWYFHLVIESLPVMLQFALLLFGCALSQYLWTINHTVARVAIAVTAFGVVAYVLFTLAAIVSYNCPYQTPPSLIIRVLIRHFPQIFTQRPHARPRRTLNKPLVDFPRRFVKNLKEFLRRLLSGVRDVLGGVGCVENVPQGAVRVPLAFVTSPDRVFEGAPIDWEVCKADTRCVAWMLDSATDIDVIFSTVRFAADMIVYPEIAEALSPHILADLFFECLSYGRVIPGKSEHAISLGMTLASVLSSQFIVDPERKDLEEIRHRILYRLLPHQEESMSSAVITTLLWVVRDPVPLQGQTLWAEGIEYSIPNNLPLTFKVWLSRLMLQTIWRWRRCQGDTTPVINLSNMGLLCGRLMADGAAVPTLFEANINLTLGICLGLTVDVRDLYIPDTDSVWLTPLDILERYLRDAIRMAGAQPNFLCSIFSTLDHLYPTQFATTSSVGISWMDEVLNSGYPEDEKYQITGHLVELLGNRLGSAVPEDLVPESVPRLLNFLLLSERFYSTTYPPYAGAIAIRVLSSRSPSGITLPSRATYNSTVVPVLTTTLLPTHTLQSRVFALKLFQRCGAEWFLPELESFSTTDRVRLLEAVGDPFTFPLVISADAARLGYEPMAAAVLLIKMLSSDLWRDHARYSNFSTCESVVSTVQGRGLALTCIGKLMVFLGSPQDVITVIRRLKALGCWNTAEVVLLWAWITGAVNPADHNGWRLIGEETLEFYRVRGIWRLTTLALYIKKNTSGAWSHRENYGWRRMSSCRVEGVRREVRVWDRMGLIAMTCQLRRLYQLFGCNPATWGGMLEAYGDQDVAPLSGSRFGRDDGPVAGGHVHVELLEFTCDYP